MVRRLLCKQPDAGSNPVFSTLGSPSRETKDTVGPRAARTDRCFRGADGVPASLSARRPPVQVRSGAPRSAHIVCAVARPAGVAEARVLGRDVARVRPSGGARSHPPPKHMWTCSRLVSGRQSVRGRPAAPPDRRARHAVASPHRLWVGPGPFTPENRVRVPVGVHTEEGCRRRRHLPEHGSPTAPASGLGEAPRSCRRGTARAPSPMAQLAARRTVNAKVPGSSPGGGAWLAEVLRTHRSAERSRFDSGPRASPGRLAEWTNALALKARVGRPTGGSNPSPSAGPARSGLPVASRRDEHLESEPSRDGARC